MAQAKQVMVGPNGDGTWGLDGSGGVSAPPTKYQTQADAEDAARKILVSAGGGELVVRGRDGQIRQKDTIAPGHDPRSTKG